MYVKGFDLEVRGFGNREGFRKWLERNHLKKPGVWLRMFKKDSGVKSVSYQEALEDAICFGWIDGQVRKFDEKSWVQRFTPRGKRSVWSKRNVGIVERLEKEGRMCQAGRNAVEAAK